MAREKWWAIAFLIVALACCPWPRPLPVPNTWHGGTVYHNILDLLSSPQLAEETPVQVQVVEVRYQRHHLQTTEPGQNLLMPNIPIWLYHFLYPYQYGSKYQKGAPLLI